MPNIQVGSVERVVPGCCTVNRLLEMIHGRGYERAGARPEEGAGNGVGRAGGGVRQRGLAGMSRDPQGPMGTGCQLPDPLSEHPGNTHRGWADRPSQTCQQLLRPQPPPASQSTRQMEAPLNPPPRYPPTRVLNSKNSQNI